MTGDITIIVTTVKQPCTFWQHNTSWVSIIISIVIHHLLSSTSPPPRHPSYSVDTFSTGAEIGASVHDHGGPPLPAHVIEGDIMGVDDEELTGQSHVDSAAAVETGQSRVKVHTGHSKVESAVVADTVDNTDDDSDPDAWGKPGLSHACSGVLDSATQAVHD